MPHKTRWRPEQPQIAELADRRPRRQLGYGIGGIVSRLGHFVERGDPQIDLAHFEAGDLEAEIEVEQRELLELLRQEPVVPARDLGQPVVGDHKSAGLRRGQVIEAQRRHLGHAELARRQAARPWPAITLSLAIDQDRDDEAEVLMLSRDLPDLLLTVAPRIGRVRLQLVNRSIDDLQAF